MAHSDQYFVPVYRWFPLLSPAPLQDLLLFLLSSSQTLSSELLHMSVKQQQLIQSLHLSKERFDIDFMSWDMQKKNVRNLYASSQKHPRTIMNTPVYYMLSIITYEFLCHGTETQRWISLKKGSNQPVQRCSLIRTFVCISYLFGYKIGFSSL